MEAKTLKALKTSIRKWRKNAAATKPEQVRLGTGNCALCKLFHPAYTKAEDEGCGGCPVARKTGKFGCRDTPYEDVVNAFDGWEWRRNGKAEFERLARAEVAFLESLLPEGEAA